MWSPIWSVIIGVINKIGHLRHSRTNYMHLDEIFLVVFLLFAKQIEYHFNFFTQKVFKDFLTWKFVLGTIN